MTKTILVPIDFSDNAYSAAQYACKMASKNKCDIELYHCYTTSSTVFSEENDTDFTLKADVLILEWKEKLLVDSPDLQIKTTCVRGLLTEVISNLTQEDSYLFIVMGTTGAGKNKSLIWGSNASGVVSKSAIPVLAIPSNYHGFKFEKVAMLTNFKPEELETLTKYLNDISSIPHLDIIHVFKNANDQHSIADMLQSWSFNITEMNGIDNVGIISQAVDEENESLDTIPEMIQHVIAENNYDIILITKTRKSFFERMFRTSISRQIALNLNRPAFFDNN